MKNIILAVAVLAALVSATAEAVTPQSPDGRKDASLAAEPEGTNTVSVEEALAELDGLVGLKPVKAEMARFVKYVRVAQQRKAAGL